MKDGCIALCPRRLSSGVISEKADHAIPAQVGIHVGGMPLIFSVILEFYKAPSECEESEGSPTISLLHTRSL